MRKVDKDLTKAPASLLRTDLHGLLDAIEKNKKLIDSSIYRGKIKNTDGILIKDEVVEALSGIYYRKCAYCEDITTPEMEHYRPNKGVTGLPKHGGYFWLCYEWSNLVPSCHECNKGGTGKGNQFPIKNKRIEHEDCKTDGIWDSKKFAAHQTPLIDEDPYLLHPEIDDPSEYLSFEIDEKKRGIALKGLDSTNRRGDETIRICNLNREELLRKRQEMVIFPILESIKKVFGKRSKKSITSEQFLDEIKDIIASNIQISQDKTLSFTLLRKVVIENPESFNSLITNQLPENQQQIIQLSFDSYFNSHS